jgi:hypothetical protein
MGRGLTLRQQSQRRNPSHKKTSCGSLIIREIAAHLDSLRSQLQSLRMSVMPSQALTQELNEALRLRR